MSLIDFDDDDEPEKPGNLRELSVSEIANALKRTVEDRFGHVRVRGEIGRVTFPRSGHVYLSLKDESAVLDGVIWRGRAVNLKTRPQEGLEVVVTGKLTTYPGSSKYQIVIESLAPAGVGALMAMLEARKKALAAEGLFAAERKKALPFLPRVIGVVTSPSGAVIRDILHRIGERFPRTVLVWPVAVQGERCASEVAAAIRGFNALPESGPVTRPDLLIVARGGGSLEDLWGFNEEIVVRAAADSSIPLISAVGHETDVTLIDHAADLRAPTPTAAAEKAVPVRTEMLARVEESGARRLRAMERGLREARERVERTRRALARPETVLAERRQRLDLASEKLPRALREAVTAHKLHLSRLSARHAPALLSGQLRERRGALGALRARLSPARLAQQIGFRRERLQALRLNGDRQRRRVEDERIALTAISGAMQRGAMRRIDAARDRLAGAARTLEVLSYRRVLERGFAVVRDDSGAVIATATAASPGLPITLEFAGETRVDARIEGSGPPRAKPAKAKPKPAAPQLDLFGE